MTEEAGRLRDRFLAAMRMRLPDHLERVCWSRARIEACQRDGLRRLLAHAIAHSPFHARRLKGLRPDTFELRDLPSLPVMTRNDLMTAFDEVITDRRLTLDAVEARLAAAGDTPAVLEGDRFAMTSGGSSGAKGVFVYDWDAMVEFVARFAAGGGTPRTGPQVVAVLVSPRLVHPSGLISWLLETPSTQVMRLPVTWPIGDLVARLNEAQPQQLNGYASVLRRLAGEQAADRLSIRPSGVSVGAERLDEAAATEITTIFGAPLLNLFACSEGLLGACRTGFGPFTFATDLAIVELVDEHDAPVPPGVRSTRILVTNLYNRVQPLIRCAVEDALTCQPGCGDHGHLVATVDGRAHAAFVYGEARVDPKTLLEPVIQAPGVLDWQVRQTPHGVDVAILTRGDVDQSKLSAAIRRALVGAGLAAPHVAVRPCDRLTRDPHTGKLRRWVQLSADHTLTVR